MMFVLETLFFNCIKQLKEIRANFNLYLQKRLNQIKYFKMLDID